MPRVRTRHPDKPTIIEAEVLTDNPASPHLKVADCRTGRTFTVRRSSTSPVRHDERSRPKQRSGLYATNTVGYLFGLQVRRTP